MVEFEEIYCKSISEGVWKNKPYFVIHAPFEMNRNKPELTGKIINIDDMRCKVIGVERWMLGTPIKINETIGVIVEFQ